MEHPDNTSDLFITHVLWIVCHPGVVCNEGVRSERTLPSLVAPNKNVNKHPWRKPIRPTSDATNPSSLLLYSNRGREPTQSSTQTNIKEKLMSKELARRSPRRHSELSPP